MSTKETSYNDEIVLLGTTASPGFAVGKAFVLEREDHQISQKNISQEEVENQKAHFYKARKALETELKNLRKDSFHKEVNDIINAQIAIVNDPELAKRIENHIENEHCSAGRAIHKAFEVYLQLLSGSSQSLAQNRTVDITDIRDRLIQVVRQDYTMPAMDERHILVAEGLSPREVIKCADKGIRGLVIIKGGRNSHAAIIARSVGIPAIVGIANAFETIATNDDIALEASTGKVIVHPGKQTLQSIAKGGNTGSSSDATKQVTAAPSQTKDGRPFILRANAGFTQELKTITEVGAEGIGLLRTESMYMDQNSFEQSEAQQVIYGQFLEQTGSHPVTIRLFDVGGDKQVGPKIKEENPFLGWRGIRMLLDHKEILDNQLRAILKVAAKNQGRVRILIPMVTDLEEVLAVKKRMASIQSELLDEGLQIDKNIMLGVMVEVPSLAVQADVFAEQVDFFSIGTNDLTQYMLAADRSNERVAGLYNQRHPSVWKVISRVQKAAEKASIEVSVCGELASDPVSAACLVGLGITELSMAPNHIVQVKALLIEKQSKEMVSLAKEILLCSTAKQVETIFQKWSN